MGGLALQVKNQAEAYEGLRMRLKTIPINKTQV